MWIGLEMRLNTVHNYWCIQVLCIVVDVSDTG